MKKHRKTLSALMCAVMLIIACFGGVSSAYAEENDDVNGDLSLEEGAEVYYRSAEEMALLQAKIDAANLHMLSHYSGSDLTDSLIFQEVTLSVPRYAQETGYYCGPATVKEIIHYFNGSSQTQAQYAATLGTTTNGTTMTVIPGVLTNAIGSDMNQYYYDDTWTTFSQWATRIMTAIDEGNPVVVDVNASAGYTSIPYTGNGHYLAVIGYIYDTQTHTLTDVKVADPSTACNSYYTSQGYLWYTASDLFNANAAHWRRAIIW